MLTGVAGAECFLLLRYVESACEPVPVSSGEPQASRILEGVDVALADVADPAAVLVARLVRDDDGGWAVDTAFLPTRAR